jgi:hypothetical protein
MPREVEVYEDVPAGSTLELGMQATRPADEGNFVGHVLLITSFEPDQNWPDADIHPGPRRHPLRARKAYILEIDTAFQGAATAVVTAKVIKPSGDVYSTPKVWNLTGTNGTQENRVLIIRTAQA